MDLGDAGRKTIKGPRPRLLPEHSPGDSCESLAESASEMTHGSWPSTKTGPGVRPTIIAKWFHVCEHEAHHTGTNRVPEKRLPSQNRPRVTQKGYADVDPAICYFAFPVRRFPIGWMGLQGSRPDSCCSQARALTEKLAHRSVSTMANVTPTTAISPHGGHTPGMQPHKIPLSSRFAACDSSRKDKPMHIARQTPPETCRRRRHPLGFPQSAQPPHSSPSTS